MKRLAIFSILLIVCSTPSLLTYAQTGPDPTLKHIGQPNPFDHSIALPMISAIEQEWKWDLPAFYPRPFVPEDNPLSYARVELGRHLFYDRRLSGNGTQACGSCHRQELAFTDDLPRSIGSTGETHPRNAQTLTNSGYNSTLTWANPADRKSVV